MICGFYIVYSIVRNRFGSASVSPREAYDNAIDVITFEERLGLFFEESVQEAFLDSRFFIQFWNVFYGTFHFAVTIGAMIWLFYRFPDRYRFARNSIAATTAAALAGFSLYPLMPPRLLGTGPPYGGAQFGGNRFNFVDTLAEYGGLWSFDSGAMQAVSNQYAAMPSLHFGWSAWSAIVLMPVLVRTWPKVLLGLYPWATLFGIIVTANHYWIDAVGGAVTLGLGFAVAALISMVRDLLTTRW